MADPDRKAQLNAQQPHHHHPRQGQQSQDHRDRDEVEVSSFYDEMGKYVATVVVPCCGVILTLRRGVTWAAAFTLSGPRVTRTVCRFQSTQNHLRPQARVSYIETS